MRLLMASLILLGMGTAASADMSMNFEWGPTKKCFDPKSPPIDVAGVPAGTATLAFTMSDVNAPGFRHGGGKVAYTGKNAIPYGAFRYKGPCPPSGTHTYVISVKALDASGKTLAKASASRPFHQ